MLRAPAVWTLTATRLARCLDRARLDLPVARLPPRLPFFPFSVSRFFFSLCSSCCSGRSRLSTTRLPRRIRCALSSRPRKRHTTRRSGEAALATRARVRALAIKMGAPAPFSSTHTPVVRGAGAWPRPTSRRGVGGFGRSAGLGCVHSGRVSATRPCFVLSPIRDGSLPRVRVPFLRPA